MTVFQKISAINRHLIINQITDESFKKYGVRLEKDTHEMLGSLACKTVCNGYIMSDPCLEQTGSFSYFRDAYYGGMPIQAGICAGDNTRLNCLEYHRGTEINIAATDMILLLAYIGDLKDNCISSRRVEAFFVPKGQCVALFETTMHFAPLSVFKSGFVSIVLLPRGTNGELENSFEPSRPEDYVLFKMNKWLIGHKDSDQVRNKNAFCGISGENISITPLGDTI